jgi:hypothetical protein
MLTAPRKIITEKKRKDGKKLNVRDLMRKIIFRK